MYGAIKEWSTSSTATHDEYGGDGGSGCASRGPGADDASGINVSASTLCLGPARWARRCFAGGETGPIGNTRSYDRLTFQPRAPASTPVSLPYVARENLLSGVAMPRHLVVGVG
jgi:hypothetical protein